VNSEQTQSWPEWPVCRVDDLSDPGAKGFYVGEGEWPFRGFVVRRGTEIYGYANICPHQRHPLDLLEDRFLADKGRLIRCASHGALFEPDTGQCISGPCFGKSLMQLEIRVGDEREVFVTAPASLRDAGPIIGNGFEPGI
jgi:nitrite reductase/ring-hydroxylating ferredoxin subunit